MLLTEVAVEPPPLIVLPYLAGSNTLDNDPASRGAIIGLSLTVTRSDLTRAFLEAAGYELAVLVEGFTAAGMTVGDIRAVGTGATSTATLAVRSSASGLPLIPARGRSSARGAGLLAAAAIGTVSLDELPPSEVGDTLQPDSATSAWYAHQRRASRELYQALKLFRPDSVTDPTESSPT